ncbi:MAG: hypothetical protein GY780_11255 [bacterium]|nr:hypothetical protein [bacterium]
MNHPLMQPVHKFYIPVMGTGFTIDTPLKVARYGISSVVSLVDDVLIEQMRQRVSGENNTPFEEIKDKDEDSRARRITSYLNLMDDVIQNQVKGMKESLFEKGSEITRYFEMLPDSPLRAAYLKMQATLDPEERSRLQSVLREKIEMGAIDVNIMTKLDRAKLMKGENLGPKFSDAMTALRGFAKSRLRSSVVLSAGMNRKLYAYLAEFSDFFPDETGDIPKRIVLKVSDFRSALIQGKLLARQGLWVSEYRIESGLNCGGHAFGGKGTLLGPVLEEFHTERARLAEQLQVVWTGAMEKMGREIPQTPMNIRVTVQGGIGTSDENQLLLEKYEVDGMGWGSPFLLVPDVINIDQDHLKKIQVAGENDVHLSGASPLGVPFWCLKTSSSEEHRRELIDDGKPGSRCPKGFLASNTEFTKAPICTASRAYQRRKLKALEECELTPVQRDFEEQVIKDKACICHDLAGSATVPYGIDPDASTAVCCGPNTVYFSRVARLREMVDHIYGRASLPINTERPHMFLKELSLHLDRLRTEVDRRKQGLIEAAPKSTQEIQDNLIGGIRHYRKMAGKLVSGQRKEFLNKLEKMRDELEQMRS